MAEGEETKPSTEETVEEVKEATPEAPEEKTKIAEEVKKEEEKEAVVRPWRKRRRGSRAVSGVSKKDFMEFARKYYPDLVKDFEAERIPFDELKRKIERDVGLVWVDLKE